jgi:hypothetical protein
MQAVVVYESMYGNTHEIAEAIGQGLRDSFDVAVLPVADATPEVIDAADVLVVGGPTHAHGMSRETTRQQAILDADRPDRDLVVDPDAEGPGLRDWIPTVSKTSTRFAAFDTRVDIAPLLSGRASKAISKKLRHQGLHEVVDPESFLVTKENRLEPGEADRASEWGRQVARLSCVPAR